MPGSRYVLTVLFLVTMLNFVDRQVVAILAEEIKRDLALTDGQIGLMTGLSFALFYTTLGIPIAALADRWNRSHIIAIAITIWSTMTLLSGLAANFVQLFLARVGVGVGEAGSAPASHSLIADIFPAERRAGALGTMGMAVPLGAFIAYTGGGWMVETVGWRTAFFIAGSPGLVIALVLWFTVDDPRPNPSLKDAFKPREGAMSFREGLFELMGRPVYRQLLAAGILVSFIAYGLASFYTGLFIRIHDISYAELGLKLGIMVAISGAGGAWLGGKVGDAVHARIPHGGVLVSAVVFLLSTPGIYFAVYAKSADACFILLSIPTFAASFYFGPYYAAVQAMATQRTRAMAMAVVLLFAGLFGLGLGPVFVGYLSDLFASQPGATSGSGLQKALSVLSLFNIWTAFHLWRAHQGLKALEAEQRP